MRVFRVEASFSIINKNGTRKTNLGPYVGRDAAGKVYGHYFNMRLLPYNPEPEEDGISYYSFNHHYGFSSLKELIKWFDGCFFSLQDAGFFVVEYECPENYIEFGGKQLAFDMTKATPIRFYTRKEYLERYKDENFNSRRNKQTALAI